MEDVHIYVERSGGEEYDTGLEGLGETLRALDYVADVNVDAPGSVIAVSYEGGRDEREEIKRTIEGAGYKISRLSVRSEFTEPERGLWDI